jgi:hypothetical protein
MCCRWMRAASKLRLAFKLFLALAILAAAWGPAGVVVAATPYAPAYGSMYGHGFGDELLLSLYLPAESLVGAAEGEQAPSQPHPRSPI